MEILNVGPLELIIILVLMFILLGPKDMVLTAYRIGQRIRSFVRSPMWREILTYSQEIRELPKKLLDDTGLEETLKEVRQTTQEATQELNEQLREVNAAARVPEAEHVRIGEGEPSLLPPASASLSAEAAATAEAASELAETSEKLAMTLAMAGEEPAAAEALVAKYQAISSQAVSLPESLQPRKARGVVTSAPVEQSAAEEQPAAVEQPAAGEPPAALPAPLEIFQNSPEIGASFAPRRSRQPAEGPVLVASEPAAAPPNGTEAHEQAPDAPQPRRARKPRATRKPKADDNGASLPPPEPPAGAEISSTVQETNDAHAE